ncbi:MAG TPA: hypothetical protein VMH81_27130 [Bryobacteraceae bacterium]|nr:hypothetical protein [Bryobacteraceae bacterium]
MVSRSCAVILGIAALLAPKAATPGQSPGAVPEPRYDPNTTVSFFATITDIREVPKTRPLNGLHLVVNTEKDEAVEVYVAPIQYLRDLGVSYVRGDRLDICGSKVKFGTASIVLAREIRRDVDTAYFRDARGKPYWSGGPT